MPSQTLYLKDRNFQYIDEVKNSKYRRLTERDRKRKTSPTIQMIIDDHEVLTALFKPKRPESLLDTIEETLEDIKRYQDYIALLSAQIEGLGKKPINLPERTENYPEKITNILKSTIIRD